jgi:hypothetical protein
VDRNGIVKVLDMGLARFFHDEEDILTKKYDENVLGTADYLAPEQALDSHTVDIRADIYSLGATFYFCLTGRTPFTEGTIAQKLIWHQTRQPKPIRQIRPEVPEGVVAIIEKMMAKDPGQRYQTPLKVAEVLLPFTQTPIPPPPESEMPRLSLAATGGSTAPESGASGTAPAGPTSPAPRKNWPSAAGTRPVSTPTNTPSVKPPGSGPAAPTPRDPRAMAVAAPGVQAVGARPRAQAVSAGRAVAVPVVEPTPAEESLPWEHLAPDTEDPAARADTAPRSAAMPAASASGSLKAVRALVSRRWLVAAVAVAVLIGCLVLVGWLVAGKSSGPTGQGSISPDAPAPPQRPAVHVSQSQRDACRSVGEALRKAKANERIVVHDPVVREALEVDGKTWRVARDLTVEPADELKEPVRWILPAKSKAPQLLVLNNLEGFTLRGFTFDGEQRAEDTILLTGRCPGLTVEDVTVQGFKRSGVLISNCVGGMGRPVSLVRLRAVTRKPDEFAVYIDLNKSVRDPNINQFIAFRDCRVEGPSKVPLRSAPALVRDVQLPDWDRR